MVHICSSAACYCTVTCGLQPRAAYGQVNTVFENLRMDKLSANTEVLHGSNKAYSERKNTASSIPMELTLHNINGTLACFIRCSCGGLARFCKILTSFVEMCFPEQLEFLNFQSRHIILMKEFSS